MTLDTRHWLQATLSQRSTKSAPGAAIKHALARWTALLRYVGDGRIGIDNNAAYACTVITARTTCSPAPMPGVSVRR
jgi:hypothetical protein